MVKAITSIQEWDALLASGDTFVVDFWATWCGPCKMISPVFEKAEASYPNVQFLKVDVDEAEEIAARVGVRAMPTFKAYKGGQEVGESVGAVPAKLTELLQKVAAL